MLLGCGSARPIQTRRFNHVPSSELPYFMTSLIPRTFVCILTSGSKSAFAAYSQILSPICNGSFVPESFGKYGLRYVSFSPRARAFVPSRCLALNPAPCWRARAVMKAAAIDSSVSLCFRAFGCALWQPSLRALTPES